MSGSVEKVKVCVRVRPMLKQDSEARSWVTCIDGTTLHTINHRNTGQVLEYQFDKVFDPDSAQKSVYSHCVKPLLPHIFKGQNASVFAYGPTGAGKTHTILGAAKMPGVIPRCVKDIFDLKQSMLQGDEKPISIDVSFSYLEIYNEKVQDLLKPSSTDLPIRQDQHKNIFVSGLTNQRINNVEEFNQYFGPASKNRSTAMTRLNEHSSRSHSILLLEVTSKHSTGTRLGKMYIIDLAGSEDNRRTGNQGVRLKESGAINSSLLALGQVVDALDKGKTCIPYRASKLTRLLQDSLGGSAHSCMIVNLAPEETYYHDTYQTLNFARKTKKIVNVMKTHETHVDAPVSVKRVAPPDEEDSQRQHSSPKKQRVDPAPFLSPLLRKQNEFKAEVRNRLEELEVKLMTQMRSTSSLSDLDSLISASHETDNTQIKPTPATLEAVLKKVKQQRNGHKDGSTDSWPALKNISSSPLFANFNPIKRRGFKSTAAPMSACVPETENTSPNEKQSVHNDQILAVLNSGDIVKIKKLQTVGAKKATMIAQWTSLNGSFQTFEDLKQAGFTSASLSTFLKKNFVYQEE